MNILFLTLLLTHILSLRLKKGFYIKWWDSYNLQNRRLNVHYNISLTINMLMFTIEKEIIFEKASIFLQAFWFIGERVKSRPIIISPKN